MIYRVGWHTPFRGVPGRFSHRVELTRPTKGLCGGFGRAAAAFRVQCRRNRAQGGEKRALNAGCHAASFRQVSKQKWESTVARLLLPPTALSSMQ